MRTGYEERNMRKFGIGGGALKKIISGDTFGTVSEMRTDGGILNGASVGIGFEKSGFNGSGFKKLGFDGSGSDMNGSGDDNLKNGGWGADGSETVLDADDAGRPLYAEDIVSDVLDDLERRRRERTGFELQWRLNTNFLYGNQRCGINLRSQTVEQYDLPDDGTESEIYNQIEPLCKTRKANLNKISYAMTVRPRTSELDDAAKAKVSTALLRYKQSVSGFDKFISKVIDWSELLGSCYVLSWWDVCAGEYLGSVPVSELGEDGNIYVREEAVYSGDVNFGLLSPYEVFPDDIYCQEISGQRSIITEQVMNIEEIYDLYGIRVSGRSVETYAVSAEEGAGGYGYAAAVASVCSRTAENSEKVITEYEKPGRRYPNGRLIIIIGDRLIHYGELPYGEIPIAVCKSDDVSGQFYGRSVIQSLIPLQRAYNGMMNTVHDYAKRLAVSSLIIEEGSVPDVEELAERIFEPGYPIRYRRGYAKPDFIEPPDFPSGIYSQIEKLRSDMEYIAGVSQLMVYGQRSGVTSGTAIQSLTEIDSTRLSTAGENIRACVLAIAKIWLSIYKKCACGYRIMKIVGGNDAGDVIVWSSESINSWDIAFDAENELIYSDETRRQNFFTALEAGLFTDGGGGLPESVKKRGLELLKIDSTVTADGVYALQLARAQRENSMFRLGYLPEIMSSDDHRLHIEEHLKAVLQFEYRRQCELSPELCRKFERHIERHRAFLNNEELKIEN